MHDDNQNVLAGLAAELAELKQLVQTIARAPGIRQEIERAERERQVAAAAAQQDAAVTERTLQVAEDLATGWVRVARARLTKNGAVSFDGGQHTPPPTEPKALLEARRGYHEARLELAEKDFSRLKKALEGGPPVHEHQLRTRDLTTMRPLVQLPPDSPGALRVLQEMVLSERRAIERIDREIGELPEERERRAQQEALAERRRAVLAATPEPETSEAAEVATITI